VFIRLIRVSWTVILGVDLALSVTTQIHAADRSVDNNAKAVHFATNFVYLVRADSPRFGFQCQAIEQVFNVQTMPFDTVAV